MPSPFPGMDPYLESWEWESFHHAFIADIGDALSPKIRPKYVTRLQQRVYVEHMHHDDARPIVGDAVVLRPEAGLTDPATTLHATPETASVEVVLSMPVKRYETFLKIQDVTTLEVVTILELLSPGNKRPGDGRREYLKKRDEILESKTHLVEIDLLRGGKRMPSASELPPGDYLAIISRSHLRPRAEAIAWSVRHRLPKIPIPLRDEDPEVTLDLQSTLDERYDRAGYDRTLDYSRPPDPLLNDADAQWAAELLSNFANQ